MLDKAAIFSDSFVQEDDGSMTEVKNGSRKESQCHNHSLRQEYDNAHP